MTSCTMGGASTGPGSVAERRSSFLSHSGQTAPASVEPPEAHLRCSCEADGGIRETFSFGHSRGLFGGVVGFLFEAIAGLINRQFPLKCRTGS